MEAMLRRCVLQIVGSIVLLLVATGCQPEHSAELPYFTSNPNALYYTNPIVEERADPWIYEHDDGYYYMMASVPEYDRLELRRATTITGLAYADAKTVFHKNETGAISKNLWAPEIFYIDDKWYIYFSAARAESEFDHRMYVLENSHANPLEGEWELKGQIKTGYESFQIDASLFEHDDIWYMMWSGAGAKGNSLYMSQLKNPWTVATTRIMLTEPEYDWEKRAVVHVTEAPEVIKYDNRIYLTYSASFCDANYNMGLLSASQDSDLMNVQSWEKSSESIFVSNPESNAYGPGHGSFVFSKNGDERIHVYHGIDGTGKGFGCDKARSVRIQPYQFDEGGQLQLGEPTSRGEALTSPYGENRVELEHNAELNQLVEIETFSKGQGVSLTSKETMVIDQLRAPDTGVYALTLAYHNKSKATYQTVKVNDTSYKFKVKADNTTSTTTLYIPMLGSTNEISIRGENELLLLDYIELNYIDIGIKERQHIANMSLGRQDDITSVALLPHESIESINLSLPKGDYVVALAYRAAQQDASLTLKHDGDSSPLTLQHSQSWQFSSTTVSTDGEIDIDVERLGQVEVAFVRVIRVLPEGELFRFINRESGIALQPNGGSKKTGTGYRQYLITNLPAQNWTLERVEAGIYKIKNELSGLYVTAEGQQVVQGEAKNIAEQHWEFIYVSDGSYRIQNSVNQLVPTSIEADPLEQENLEFTIWEHQDRQVWLVSGIK